MQEPLIDQERVHPDIIIVASDNKITEFFRSGLRMVGYKVAGYEYSPDVLERIKSDKPHLIILELSFVDDANSEGLDIFRVLKEDKATRDCPILILKEKSQDLLLQNIEADGFITRPFDFEDVIEQVNALIGHFNPQLSRPIKGFLFRADNPPPELRGKFGS